MTLALRLAADAVALLHLGVRPVRGVRWTVGWALASTGVAPPAGGGLGGVDRIRRLGCAR